MGTHVRRRFWLEVALTGLVGTLAVLTVIWPNWFEVLFGTAPDDGDGSFEWLVTVGLGVAALVMTVLARLEWRRHPHRLAAS
jgi:hypothetical protein